MLSLDEVKKQFPIPMSIYDTNHVPGAYCVGGAICATTLVTIVSKFPSWKYIADALLLRNPGLTTRIALQFAYRVVYENDRRNFDAAWAAVENAINWRPENNEPGWPSGYGPVSSVVAKEESCTSTG